MIKFNDDNIFVGHIKELLHSFNLPVCKVKKDDSKFYIGEYYIDRDLEEVHRVTATDSDNNVVSHIKICDYKFNDEILNLTKHLEIRNNFYDSYTHAYLGKYLRFLRDYLDLDLMSMYNCFTNESPANIDIEIADKLNENYVIPVTNTADYNIFMIPVCPNKKYTLSLEYLNTFSIFFGFYSHNKFIEMINTPPDDVNSIEAQSFRTYDSGCSANKPIILESPELTTEEEIRQESNLKLFICLPVSYTSNIVLLEGDYSKNLEKIYSDSYVILGNKFFEYIPEGFEIENGYWLFDGESTGKESSFMINSCVYNKDTHKFTVTFSDSSTWISSYINARGNYDYITRNQLLEFQTSVKYLLADRLQEYLTDNVITHIDEIINNIKRVQILMAACDNNFNSSQYGVWDKDMSDWIYKYISTHGRSGEVSYRDVFEDVLCFVDKDVESVLIGLKQAIENKPENERTERENNALRELDNLGGIYYA